jgi:hypothetical protein
MRQIISYIRVSTGKQGRSGLGIDAQRDAIARFAAAEGREVLAEFVEVETGKGADALDRRPMLAEALTKARKIKAPGREALPTISRRAVHLRPDGQASAVHRDRAWSRRGPVHAAPVCGSCAKRAGADRRANQGGVGPEESARCRSGKPDQLVGRASQGRRGKPAGGGRLRRQRAADCAPDTGGRCNHVARHCCGVK